MQPTNDQPIQTERIAIIGDGQMALVLAELLVTMSKNVRLWGPFPEHVEQLIAKRPASVRLPDLAIPDAIDITHDDAAILTDCDIVINAIPTQYIRPVWQRLKPYYQTTTHLISVSKGIEEATLLAPLEILADVLHDDVNLTHDMVCVSGPTIATELARHLPATVVAASQNHPAALATQQLLTTPWLRVYTHDDVIGVEIAGAVKNVIALAAGMLDGLDFGDNAKSALLARGLAEITRLGLALGARPETFFGVAGVGDLATTCFSKQGRNRTCGERIGRGESLDAILQDTASVVEGIPTTRAVVQLAAQHEVDMPITRAIHAVLFDGLPVAEAIASLMGRDPKPERIG